MARNKMAIHPQLCEFLKRFLVGTHARTHTRGFVRTRFRSLHCLEQDVREIAHRRRNNSKDSRRTLTLLRKSDKINSTEIPSRNQVGKTHKPSHHGFFLYRKELIMSRYKNLKETLPTYSEADDYLQVIGPEPDHDDSRDIAYELISIDHPLYHRYTSNNWRKTHNLPLRRSALNRKQLYLLPRLLTVEETLEMRETQEHIEKILRERTTHDN